MGVTPVIIHFSGGFSIINQPFWGSPILGNPQISFFSVGQQFAETSCGVWPFPIDRKEGS